MELGSPTLTPNLYISRHDGNSNTLDSGKSWVDYAMT